LSVLKITSEPKSGPALHTHLREDELWWVLEGDYRFKAGDSLFKVGQGGMAFGPRGTPHCFQNVGDTPGRSPTTTPPGNDKRHIVVRRRDRLGGLLHEYQQIA
jgi:mannose-6-phosphate isomerase-like protein (cupin superfamily)